MQTTIFQGLKVIELASVLAGPSVGMFFAELGAEVIKIENKTTQGDVTRRWKLPSEDKNAPHSAYYCSVNWGKQVKFLNLKEAQDRAEVQELIKSADVVITNYKAGAAEKLGMDATHLQSLNPRLIYAYLSAFGEESHRTAFDVVLQAEAGFLFMTGEPDREPVKMPVALIDILAAHQLKEAILLALYRRTQTGQGSYVSVSLLEAAVASLANQATNWLMAGHVPQRMGTMHPNIAPYGDIFYTRDQKPVILAVGTEKQFVALCQCINLPHLPNDDRFAQNQYRVQNRQALKEALAPAIKTFDLAEVMEVFHKNGVPAGQIRTMPEVFEQKEVQHMILEERMSDNTISKRVRTAAFDMRPNQL
ncbi:CaiB/BaiF CoA-transferase family protein [uncultured Microscilla sp.]|uniref:CaiB/BaiF CoA transferase family protein n=1 Tax=uncultured Microscilla sp. TaxID=432653 RepID=UPI002637E939|nr:CaiB/BaiF CoA-transferase family protein [uncultured Microscilla sp.]